MWELIFLNLMTHSQNIIGINLQYNGAEIKLHISYPSGTEQGLGFKELF